MAGKACATEGDEELCYDGPDSSKAKGACVSGVQKCTDGAWSECFGQVLPGDEMCNGNDDDCDGQIDEDVQADCVAPGTGCAGILVCEQGRSICAATVDPVAGGVQRRSTTTATARPTKTPIKPAPTTTSAAAPTAQAISLARAFARPAFAIAKPASSKARAAGKPSRTRRNAAARKTASRSTRTATVISTRRVRAPAADRVRVYNGPDTPHRSARASPERRRAATVYGARARARSRPSPRHARTTLPTTTATAKIDDVPGLGVDCTSNGLGRCHNGKQQCVGATLQCVTPSATDEVCNGLDDDCNGKTDEPFALQTDESNCGRCGMNCATNRTCCSGMCVDTETSNGHCGMCNHVCGSGFSCCGADCVDFQSDNANCGSCGHACGSNQDLLQRQRASISRATAKTAEPAARQCLLGLVCLSGGCVLCLHDR